jgi:hypothetical protein
MPYNTHSRISDYCQRYKGTLEPLALIGKLKYTHRSPCSMGDNLAKREAVTRFLDRVTLHLLINQPSDATETLYKEIDK